MKKYILAISLVLGLLSQTLFATIAATVVWSVRNDGSDTLNGGCFDPGQTAGMLTDGAATSATGNSPVFTSASYNFVAGAVPTGDVGAWVYIASGTNWTPGWYQIASVASNAATLTASIGSASNTTRGLNTVAGCATVASPTGATWSIDYSRTAAARCAFTDLASAGAGNTVSSALKPFGKQFVGNGLIVTSGTNFTAGIHVIASVAGVTATVLPAGSGITTGTGSSGVGGLGGALLSPALVASKKVLSNGMWVKSGTYSITTASTNVAGGCVSWASTTGVSTAPDFIGSYNTVPGDFGVSLTATKPLFQASGAITSFTLFACAQAYTNIFGIDVDAVSKASGAGYSFTGAKIIIYGCKASNCTTGITFSGQGGGIAFCEVTGCTGGGAGIGCLNHTGAGFIYGCYSHDNTNIGIQSAAGGSISYCVSANNFGASVHGIATRTGSIAMNNTSYNNGGSGFFDYASTNTTAGSIWFNNIATNNTGWGYSAGGVYLGNFIYNNASYSNTAGEFDTTNVTRTFGNIILTGLPFTNAGSADYTLNNTAGAGAACRAAGLPGKLPGLSSKTSYLDLGMYQAIAGGGQTSSASAQ